MNSIEDAANDILRKFYSDCDIVPTIGGRCQRHPHGLVGNLFRIKTPESVRVGNCFMSGRLKQGDLWLCTNHSGDCFQTYIYVEEYANCLIGNPALNFGSYGIGDSESVDLASGEFEILKGGGRVKRTWPKKETVEAVNTASNTA
jgi:hypothetical protein